MDLGRGVRPSTGRSPGPLRHRDRPNGPRRLALLLVAVLTVASCSSGESSGSGSDTDTGAFLYVVDANSGSAIDERLTLSLDGDARVTVFSDRPEREAWRLPVPALVAGWAAMFGDDPPNASLVASAAGVDETSVVVLSNPQLSGTRELSFTYEPVTETPTLNAEATGDPPTEFASASLFVDSSAAPPSDLSELTLPPPTLPPISLDPDPGTTTTSTPGSGPDFLKDLAVCGDIRAKGATCETAEGLWSDYQSGVYLPNVCGGQVYDGSLDSVYWYDQDWYCWQISSTGQRDPYYGDYAQIANADRSTFIVIPWDHVNALG